MDNNAIKCNTNDKYEILQQKSIQDSTNTPSFPGNGMATIQNNNEILAVYIIWLYIRNIYRSALIVISFHNYLLHYYNDTASDCLLKHIHHHHSLYTPDIYKLMPDKYSQIHLGIVI